MIAFGLFPRIICTLAKLPGINAGSLLFTNALTVRLLVFSPIVVSVAITFAEKVFSEPFTVKETGCAFLISEPYFSGTLNCSFSLFTSLMVVTMVDGVTKAPGLTYFKPSLPLNGALISVLVMFAFVISISALILFTFKRLAS